MIFFKSRFLILLTLLSGALLPVFVDQGHAQNQLQVAAVTSGGTVSSSSAYSLEGSVGQIATRSGGGTNVHAFSGIWPAIYSSELITDIKREDPEPKDLPDDFSLQPAYPNPFNPATRISYTLPKPARVYLAVYNMLGQRVRILVDKHQEAGRFTVNFRADQLSSGIYLYRMKAADFVKERKVTLVK